jgi:hypothetical protein
VLTADVRFEGFSTEDWIRLIGLVQTRSMSKAGLLHRGVIVLYDRGQVLKVVHTRLGRIDPARLGRVLQSTESASTPWPCACPSNLASVARAFRGDWVLSMQVGAFDDVMERFGARVRREDDLTAQTLKLAECVCEVMDEGALGLWPSRVRGALVRTPRLIRTALDALCADGHVVVLGVFDRASLHTAVLARRRGLAFDLIAGPEIVRDVAHTGNWRSRLPAVTGAIAQRVGPLGLGCFGELSTVRELLGGAPAGSLVRAVAAKDIILSPPTFASQMALGIDGMGALLRRLRRASERVALLVAAVRWFDAAVAGVASRAGCDGGTSLGLDAVSVLRVLLAR